MLKLHNALTSRVTDCGGLLLRLLHDHSVYTAGALRAGPTCGHACEQLRDPMLQPNMRALRGNRVSSGWAVLLRQPLYVALLARPATAASLVCLHMCCHHSKQMMPSSQLSTKWLHWLACSHVPSSVQGNVAQRVPVQVPSRPYSLYLPPITPASPPSALPGSPAPPPPCSLHQLHQLLLRPPPPLRLLRPRRGSKRRPAPRRRTRWRRSSRWRAAAGGARAPPRTASARSGRASERGMWGRARACGGVV
jgi:hypothetical protein